MEGVRELTDKPFGANIMIMNPANPEILKILAEAGVKTVTTSAGSPAKIYPLIHDLGMKGLHVLLALPHAIRAAGEGADGLVVSGSESGGLRSMGSESSTMVLVPLVADHVKIPVVAAGGIADRRGYRAALALGAQGVQIGTRFIASEEAPAPQVWKEAILACGDGGTTLVPLKNMKMRVIPNKKLVDLSADPICRSFAGIQSDERPEGLDERRLRSLPRRRRPGGRSHRGDQARQGHYRRDGLVSGDEAAMSPHVLNRGRQEVIYSKLIPI